VWLSNWRLADLGINQTGGTYATTNKERNVRYASHLGLTSYAMYNSKLQFSLNGTKMLPYNGIENENQQLAMLNDTFGTHILPQGAQMFDLANKTSLYKAHNVFNNAALLEANNLPSLAQFQQQQQRRPSLAKQTTGWW